MGEHDDLLRGDGITTWTARESRLAAALRAVEAERDELRIAIHGGCGCPAPYTECPHDEPLLPALNEARRRLNDACAILRAHGEVCSRAGALQVLEAHADRLDVPAADPATEEETP